MVPLGTYLFSLTNTSDLITLIVICLALVVLVLCSAFFSSAETTYSSVNVIRLKSFVEEKKKGAVKALWIAENYEQTLTTILVGNNLVNIGATTLAALLFNKIIPSNELLSNILNTVVMTIIILIFGEILPKCTAKKNAENKALSCSGVLYFLIKVLTPITFFFRKLQSGLNKNKEAVEEITVTNDELDDIIDTMAEEGAIDDDDAELMHGMLDTNTTTVYDIMVPRVDVIGVDIEDSIEDIQKLFFEYKFSRIPVYAEDKDHIVGILSERDFFTSLIQEGKVNLRTLVKKPIYVSKTMKVDDLIRLMQKEKRHFAIVTDEYGGTSGIVTMEDAIEVITGEIYDEHDDITDEVIDYKKIDDNTFVLNAGMQMVDLFEMFEFTNLPESNYSNVGGFIYSISESLPKVGESFEFLAKLLKTNDEGMTIEYQRLLHFTIMSVKERRIINVKLTLDEEVPVTESEETNE